MTPLETRKNELLVESAINRQVLRLECEYLKQGGSWLKAGAGEGPIRWLAPVAGVIFAVVLRRQLGPALIGKLWEWFKGARRSEKSD